MAVVFGISGAYLRSSSKRTRTGPDRLDTIRRF